jgi:hypothetical protein
MQGTGQALATVQKERFLILTAFCRLMWLEPLHSSVRQNPQWGDRDNNNSFCQINGNKPVPQWRHVKLELSLQQAKWCRHIPLLMYLWNGGKQDPYHPTRWLPSTNISVPSLLEMKFTHCLIVYSNHIVVIILIQTLSSSTDDCPELVKQLNVPSVYFMF